MGPKKDKNEAREEAEGEGPDQMDHVQASGVHRGHSWGRRGVRQKED